MIWRDHRLDYSISKAKENVILWKAERGLVKIDKDALALPIMQDNEQIGFIFHGRGTLILDTIVETERGAIGKPEEKELKEPFLMLGPAEEIQQNLIKADNDDFGRMGYETDRGFIVEGEKLCAQFFGKTCISGNSCDHMKHKVIFAFPNKSSKLDVLVAHNNKLVYKSNDKVFISHDDKTVLRTPEQVVLTGSKKLCVLKKRYC